MVTINVIYSYWSSIQYNNYYCYDCIIRAGCCLLTLSLNPDYCSQLAQDSCEGS